MSAATELEYEFELDQQLGLANELVHEYELEHEMQSEHEDFFNNLAAMADKSGQSQALRRIAINAARAALRVHARPWPIIEGESEFGEYEYEHGEHELQGVSPARLAAMMEHAGHAAAEAANEQEAAEHFLPLIPIAAKLVLPKIAGMAAKKLGGKAVKQISGQLIKKVAPKLIRRITPQLTRSVANVTRQLYRNPNTRPLIHAVPRIARTTIIRLGRQIASGRQITPKFAIQTLAQQTARTLSDPRLLANTYRRSRRLDLRHHKHTRRIIGVPYGTPVRSAVTPIRPTIAARPSGFNVCPPCQCQSWPNVSYKPVYRPVQPLVCPTCGR